MCNCIDIDLDKSLIVQIYDLQQENQQLKEVIEEIREYIEDLLFDAGEMVLQ